MGQCLNHKYKIREQCVTLRYSSACLISGKCLINRQVICLENFRYFLLK